MARKIASLWLLVFFLVGCSSAQKPVTQNKSANTATKRESPEKISLYKDATLSIQKADASTFAGVEISGRPFVVNLELDPGTSDICIVRSFNDTVEGDLPASFILLIGDRKIPALAWMDYYPIDEKDQARKIEVVGDTFLSSTLCSGKGTTSLLFDLSADELNQLKKFSVKLELVEPEEKGISFQVDLK